MTLSATEWESASLAENEGQLSLTLGQSTNRKAEFLYSQGGLSYSLQSPEMEDPETVDNIVLSRNGRLTVPGGESFEETGEGVEIELHSRLNMYPVVGDTYFGAKTSEYSRFNSEIGLFPDYFRVNNELFFMTRVEQDGYSGELRGAYGVVQLAVASVTFGDQVPEPPENTPTPSGESTEDLPQPAVLSVENVEPEPEATGAVLLIASNSNLITVTGGTVSGAGSTAMSSNGVQGRGTLIGDIGVLSTPVEDDEVTRWDVTAGIDGRLSISSDSETPEPDAQLSPNGQLFWQKGFLETNITQTFDGVTGNLSLSSGVSVGLRTDTSATLSSLDGKSFRVTGLEFYASKAGDSVEVEAGTFSGAEIRFENGEMILDGAIFFANVASSGGLPHADFDLLSHSFTPSVSNGKLTATLTEGDETISISGYIGTDEDSVEGSDALILSLTAYGQPGDNGASSEDITHAVLIASAK